MVKMISESKDQSRKLLIIIGVTLRHKVIGSKAFIITTVKSDYALLAQGFSCLNLMITNHDYSYYYLKISMFQES